MKFFKKGDRVLIKYCSVRDYIGCTGTVISHTENNIHLVIDEEFHSALNKARWIIDPTLWRYEVVPIGTKMLKNE